VSRAIFFTFDYERDIWRANDVFNSWNEQGLEIAGFYDDSRWEDSKNLGEASLQHLINEELDKTTATVVLIGSNTSTLTYVQYAIDETIRRGSGLMGLRIHKSADESGRPDWRGPNPLPMDVPVYDWGDDNGFDNFRNWVEDAASTAGM